MAAAAVLRLEGEVTIAHAAAQRERLQAAVHEAAGGLAVDCGDVAAIDSAGIQLLLAARHSLARDGRPFGLRNVGPAVADALSVYGLDALALRQEEVTA